jgi:hypothetical protein
VVNGGLRRPRPRRVEPVAATAADEPDGGTPALCPGNVRASTSRRVMAAGPRQTATNAHMLDAIGSA